MPLDFFVKPSPWKVCAWKACAYRIALAPKAHPGRERAGGGLYHPASKTITLRHPTSNHINTLADRMSSIQVAQIASVSG